VKLLENLDCGSPGSRSGRGKFNLDWLLKCVRVITGEKPSEFEFLVQDFASITAQRATALPRESLLAREYAIKNYQQKVGSKKDPWTGLSFVRFVQLFDGLCRSESFGKEVRRLESLAETVHFGLRNPNSMFGGDKVSVLSNLPDNKVNALIEHEFEPRKVMASIVRVLQSHLSSSDMDNIYFPSQNFLPRYELSPPGALSCDESMSLQHLRGGIFDDPEVCFIIILIYLKLMLYFYTTGDIQSLGLFCSLPERSRRAYSVYGRAPRTAVQSSPVRGRPLAVATDIRPLRLPASLRHDIHHQEQMPRKGWRIGNKVIV
jgi:hypothetical protein